LWRYDKHLSIFPQPTMDSCHNAAVVVVEHLSAEIQILSRKKQINLKVDFF
jgi:hypothetical protein